MRAILLIFALLTNTAALAKSEKVASFVFAKDATVENTDKVTRKAKRKGKIFLHESIRTGAEGSAQIWTRDKAKFSLRPNSHITINKFLQTATDCSVEVGLHSGSIRTTTGACGRNSVIKSSVGAITSLGTDHEALFIPQGVTLDGFPNASPGLYEKVNEGRVVLDNTAGDLIVGAGEVGFIADANAVPKIIPMPDFFSIGNTVTKKKKKSKKKKKVVKKKVKKKAIKKKVAKKKVVKKVEKKAVKKVEKKSVKKTSAIKKVKVVAENTKKASPVSDDKESKPEEVKEAKAEEVEEVEVEEAVKDIEEVTFFEDDTQELEVLEVDDAELELELDVPEAAVVEINLPPVFDESLIVEITENSTESVLIPTKDNEGDTVVYSLTTEDDNEFFSISNDGVLTFNQSPDYETKNQYTVTVVVTEVLTSRGEIIEEPNSNSYTYNVNVLDDNDVPILASDIVDSAIDEDIAYNYNISSNFDDDDARTDGLDFGVEGAQYTATLASGSDLPTWLSLDRDTGIFLGTPLNADANQTLDIVVTRTDNADTSISDNFTLVVSNTNDAPTANTPIDHSAKTYSNLTVDPSIYFDDVDVGDSLNYTISMGDKDEATLISEGVVTKNDDGTYDLLLDSQGDFTIGLSVQDNDGESIDTQFTTSVSNYVLKFNGMAEF